MARRCWRLSQNNHDVDATSDRLDHSRDVPWVSPLNGLTLVGPVCSQLPYPRRRTGSAVSYRAIGRWSSEFGRSSDVFALEMTIRTSAVIPKQLSSSSRPRTPRRTRHGRRHSASTISPTYQQTSAPKHVNTNVQPNRTAGSRRRLLPPVPCGSMTKITTIQRKGQAALRCDALTMVMLRSTITSSIQQRGEIVNVDTAAWRTAAPRG